MPRITMFDINKFCANNAGAREANIQYLKKTTAGNDPSISKAMRYSQYIRTTKMRVGVALQTNVNLENITLLQQFIYGDVASVNSLLDRIDINAYDEYNWNALSHASYTNNIEKVNALIAAGVNLNSTDIYGWTALYWANARNNVNIYNILIQNGATNV